jgi:CRISPR-associated protein Cas6
MDFLEIQFALRGKTLPSDHGYALYSAVKRQLQEQENESLPNDLPAEVHLCTISGVPDRAGMIYLNRDSRFRLRCPSNQIQLWYRFFSKSGFGYSRASDSPGSTENHIARSQ